VRHRRSRESPGGARAGTALRERSPGTKKIESKAKEKIDALDRPLTSEEQRTLRRYAGDLSRLWHAPTTRMQERKHIVPCLMETVVVTAPKEAPAIKAEIQWAGGEVTTVEVARGKTGVHRYVADPELVELIPGFAGEFSDAQTACILNRKGLRTAKGLAFTAYRVSNLRRVHGIEIATGGKRLQGDDVYTAKEAVRVLGVNQGTVIRWLQTGLLRGSQFTGAAPWRVRVTEQDRRRLTAADAPEGWLTLKRAAYALGVSQQTILQRHKAGDLK